MSKCKGIQGIAGKLAKLIKKYILLIINQDSEKLIELYNKIIILPQTCD